MTLLEAREKVHRILSEFHLQVALDHNMSIGSWIQGTYPQTQQPPCPIATLSLGTACPCDEPSLHKPHPIYKTDHDTSETSTYRCQFFNHFGFIHIPSFADLDHEVVPMKEQMRQFVDNSWNVFPPHDDNNDESKNKNQIDLETIKPLAVFRTDDQQLDAIQQGQDYFLSSADRVHFFAEKDALDEHGQLKEEFHLDKMSALNKVGHGLHIFPGPFHDYSTSVKIQDLVYELGWRDPVIPQSMYIFKQAFVGAEVTSHQDSTFLYTYPRQSCLGLWLALDDATMDNGCLWVRPQSNLEPLRRKFVRNPDYFGQESIQSRLNIPQGDVSKSQMIFIEEHKNESVSWEGKLPPGCISPPSYQGLFDAGFIPIECKAGDLVVFPGTLDHLSLPNASHQPRHTFQLHSVEGPLQGFHWAESNWLQYPPGKSFLSIRK